MKNKPSPSAFRHWYKQQIAAFVLIPLFLYGVGSFWFAIVEDGAFPSAVSFVQNPLNATMLILLIVTGFYHGAAELVSIVDDYVHHPLLHKLASLKIKLSALLLSIIGTLAVLKIFLGL